jgi:hypothetical protein
VYLPWTSAIKQAIAKDITWMCSQTNSCIKLQLPTIFSSTTMDDLGVTWTMQWPSLWLHFQLLGAITYALTNSVVTWCHIYGDVWFFHLDMWHYLGWFCPLNSKYWMVNVNHLHKRGKLPQVGKNKNKN